MHLSLVASPAGERGQTAERVAVRQLKQPSQEEVERDIEKSQAPALPGLAAGLRDDIVEHGPIEQPPLTAASGQSGERVSQGKTR